jgi:hypothetical protein
MREETLRGGTNQRGERVPNPRKQEEESDGAMLDVKMQRVATE